MIKMKGYLQQNQIRCNLSPRWQLLAFLKICLTVFWKCWVLWSALPPVAGGREITSGSKDLQRLAGKEGTELTCAPAQPPASTKGELIPRQLPDLWMWAHKAQPPQLLCVMCKSSPFAEAAMLWNLETWNCSHISQHSRETRRSTCQQVGAPGDSQGLWGPSFLDPAVTYCM